MFGQNANWCAQFRASGPRNARDPLEMQTRLKTSSLGYSAAGSESCNVRYSYEER